jgi:hypothetical protein
VRKNCWHIKLVIKKKNCSKNVISGIYKLELIHGQKEKHSGKEIHHRKNIIEGKSFRGLLILPLSSCFYPAYVPNGPM